MKSVAIATACAVLAVMAGRVLAQGDKPYALHEMNFDMWCQEQKHYPADRCDRRLPADDAEFQAYRNQIEKYEIPYLQRRRDEQNLNRVILHNDPVDHPTLPSQPEQSDQPSGH
ncbi:MAG TPA: hypothetical protein VGI20_03390 [Rhizomicrobium sp.]|jgi:hypothetical protein